VKLRLVLRPARGALERVLLAASRRGFATSAVTAREQAGRLDVELEGSSPRDAEVLSRALARLFDVETVEVVA